MLLRLVVGAHAGHLHKLDDVVQPGPSKRLGKSQRGQRLHLGNDARTPKRGHIASWRDMLGTTDHVRGTLFWKLDALGLHKPLGKAHPWRAMATHKPAVSQYFTVAMLQARQTSTRLLLPLGSDMPVAIPDRGFAHSGHVTAWNLHIAHGVPHRCLAHSLGINASGLQARGALHLGLAKSVERRWNASSAHHTDHIINMVLTKSSTVPAARRERWCFVADFSATDGVLPEPYAVHHPIAVA